MSPWRKEGVDDAEMKAMAPRMTPPLVAVSNGAGNSSPKTWRDGGGGKGGKPGERRQQSVYSPERHTPTIFHSPLKKGKAAEVGDVDGRKDGGQQSRRKEMAWRKRRRRWDRKWRRG